MTEKILVGDIVESIAGHDRGNKYLVIKTEGKFLFIVDGKSRKILSPKKKSIKHVKVIKPQVLIEIAERLSGGQPVGNERLYKAVKSVTKQS